MTLRKIVRKHRNKICILTPKLRDAARGWVESWKVVQTTQTVDAAQEALDYYEREGLHVVALSTCEDTDRFPNLALPPERVAEFYRCLFNQEVG